LATINRFEDLEIWQLGLEAYKIVSALGLKIKKSHDYRFAAQMKAAAGSIIDNIAEGFERNSRLEFLNSLSIAKGECGELKSQLYRCLNDGYLVKEEFDSLLSLLQKLTGKIAVLIQYLNNTTQRGLKFKNRRDL
jgi:four helix bundle protein